MVPAIIGDRANPFFTPRGGTSTRELADQHLQHLDPIHLPPNLLFTMASAHGDLRHLLPGNYKRVITSWLEEDCPSLDYGGFVVGESEGEARLLGKSKVNQQSL